MLEAHLQIFDASPYFRDIEPSPIEALSYNLTGALLSLGINHDVLRDTISSTIWNYLDSCAQSAEFITSHASRQDTVNGGHPADWEDAVSVARVTLSLLGFLDATATYANFWTADERLALLQRIKSILSEGFLVAVETAFSTIRNAHSPDRILKEWKRYFRHYAGIGRPLGAMLLHRSFMWLLVATSSLLVADVSTLKDSDVLDLMLSGDAIARPAMVGSEERDITAIETMAELAADEMSLLEDGADYLSLGSAWQQRLAFAVKAAALTSYLNCIIINDDAAEIDLLTSWLEDTLADSVQMADETLASVVLRCMALVARLSPALAPNISKLLPRFIVQGGPAANTVAVASTCLAYILQMLSQDAVISTLYALGNVLSSGSTDRSLNGSTTGDSSLIGNGSNNNFYNSHQNAGSAISLAMTGEEEISLMYGNVVQAICVIASKCGDEKITALAQSMLLQKIFKINKVVDARIIYDTAVLSFSGGPLEFRSLLKLYGRLASEGVAQNNKGLLNAVSKGSVCFLAYDEFPTLTSFRS